MIQKKIIKQFKSTQIAYKIDEFDNLTEFYNYIINTPFNKVFENSKKDSIKLDEEFTGTKTFEEAVELFKNGWKEMAEMLNKKMKVLNKSVQPTVIKRKNYYDVVGFQASVPRYLQGLPTTMINQKQIIQKQKVITLNKNISYTASVKKENIIENSIKILQIIQTLEAQGIRVNLNLIFGTEAEIYGYKEKVICKIRLKSANERLNISKLVFPLIHPSMLRRLLFRYIEVSPNITLNEFNFGYGFAIHENELQEILNKNEYLLPRFVKNVEETIVEIFK